MRKKVWLTLGVVIAIANQSSALAEGVDDGKKDTSNQQVLDDWKSKSGQEGSISKSGGLEWHGELTTDVYNVETRDATDNPALSGLQEGNFQLTRLQGDLRTNADIEGEAVNYLQGVISMTNDRAVQTKYTTQINTLQAGRAGAGYQIAVGDVVASFSQLGSNLGLRGVSGAWQISSTTLHGYTGRVTPTWESLLKKQTLDGSPSRTQFLREVSGGKLEYKLNDKFQLFGTAQTYKDIQSSLNALLVFGQNTNKGSTGTVGAKYQTAEALVTAEAGLSRHASSQANTKNASDQAYMVDASYRWQTAGMRAGYHSLGVDYTSLAQTVAPGVRDAYIGGDWFILPNLSYGAEVRRTDTRLRNVFDSSISKNTLDSLSNQLSYSFTNLPGLNIALQDSRNWGENRTNTSRNNNTQLSTYYSTQQYNASMLLGVGTLKNSANPNSNSDTNTVQITLGRQIQAGEIKFLPNVSLSAQLNGGYSRQRLENGQQTRTNSQGLSLSSQAKVVGQFMLSLQNQDTTRPDAGNPLNTKMINFDWKKAFSEVLAIKAYVHGTFRNHGEKNLYVDEKIIGLQADYLW